MLLIAVQKLFNSYANMYEHLQMCKYEYKDTLYQSN